MPYFLRHYSTLASQIIIWDEQSTDGTREIIQSCPKAQLRDWPCKGLDDDRFLEAVNNWYKMARGSADWVMWPDIDEILYHPNPLQVLASANGDMVHATGYAMISKGNPPSGEGQIYDELRTGCRQNNYDKWIIWRPGVEIQHTAGRHTYGWQWPRCNGRRSTKPNFKLLHYHYFGVDYTRQRNKRNYDRACNKRYAWNYSDGHNNNPKQNGSVAWVKAMLESGCTFDVFQHDSSVVHH